MAFEFKAIRWKNKNSPLQIKTTTLPIRQDKSGNLLVNADNILVKVHAAALNPIDLLMKNAATPGFVWGERGFGMDYSGEIVAIGYSAAQKTSLRVGDKVCGINLDSQGNGTVAEYTLVDPFHKSGASIRRIPSKLSYEQAAAYPLVAGTAESLFESCKTKNFDKVLILAAGTSVGRYAVQFAKQVYGSKTIVVTCLGKTEPLARNLGATEVIDYTKTKSILNPVLESVKQTGKFDAIFDCAGNHDLFDNMDTILHSRKENGSYVTIAGDNKLDYRGHPMRMFLCGYTVIRLLRSMLGLLPYYYKLIMMNGGMPWPDRVCSYMEEKDIEIFIDSVHPMEKIEEAVARLQSNKATGKVVITI